MSALSRRQNYSRIRIHGTLTTLKQAEARMALLNPLGIAAAVLTILVGGWVAAMVIYVFLKRIGYVDTNALIFRPLYWVFG
jgi:hypothetical protein